MSTGYSINGRPVSLAEFRRGAKGIEPGAPPRAAALGNWPLCSDAVGVHPQHRRAAYEDSVRQGVPTEFNEQGQAVFHSRSHRKRYCRAIGYRDLDGGYGDP